MSAETGVLKPGEPDWRGTWGLWQADLPNRLQVCMRRIFRRWVFACVGGMLGVLLTWLLQADAVEEVWRTEQALETLRRQVSEVPVLQTAAAASGARMSAEGAAHLLDHLPGQAAQARLWPALHQVFERRHVQLLSLRPVEERLAPPLSSLALALRLQARFDDWAQVWADLSEGVPVWSMDRVRITPLTDPQGLVEIDVVLRVWLREGPDGPLAWSGRGGAVLAPASHVSAVFVSDKLVQMPPSTGAPQDTQDTATATSAGPNDSPDPEHWPWARMRLMGIWQQSPARQAILGFGPHWAWARTGQRVSLEGHVLETIGDQSVSVRSVQGTVQVLNLQKAP